MYKKIFTKFYVAMIFLINLSLCLKRSFVIVLHDAAEP